MYFIVGDLILVLILLNLFFCSLYLLFSLHSQILRNAVSKTYNRICDLRKEISSLNKGITSTEEAAAKAKTELETAESKLSLVDGEPVLGENPARLKRLKSYAEKVKEEEMSIRESLEAKEALLARALDENEVISHIVNELLWLQNLVKLKEIDNIFFLRISMSLVNFSWEHLEQV